MTHIDATGIDELPRGVRALLGTPLQTPSDVPQGTRQGVDAAWLRLAKKMAAASQHPSHKVGAIVVDGADFCIAQACNRYPFGSEGTQPGLHMTHAEAYVIASTGSRRDDLSTLYCTHPPCDVCAALIVAAGISRVVHYAGNALYLAAWGDSCEVARGVMERAGVEVQEVFEI
jgi:dCMP deaminase